MSAKIKDHRGNNPKYKPKGVSSRAFEKTHWPYLPILIIAGILLSFGGQTGALQMALNHQKNSVLAYATSMSVGGLLNSSNAQRTANGVAGLSLNGQLNAAAQAKANDMASRNYWSHNTPEGNPPWVFVSAQGYSYQKLGENLAAGFTSEQATIDGWMNSPPHRENLLDSSFSDVGFGFANNDNYTSAGGGPMTVVVAFYGKPSGAPAARVAPAAPKATPPAPAAPAAPNPQPTPPTPTPETATPTPTESQAELEKKFNDAKASDSANKQTPEQKPVNTDNPTSGVTLSYKTSRAQLAFAHLPVAGLATGIAGFMAVTALILWVSKHALAARKAVKTGERFVIRHPLVDIGLVTIAACAYLLTQTAGLIK
jgi:hypothetical protein